MKLPPITTRGKLAWGSSKFHAFSSFIEKVGFGLVLTEEPKLGLLLGAVSGVFDYLSECNVEKSCNTWEYNETYFVGSLVSTFLKKRKKPDFVYEVGQDSIKTEFWELDPGVWVGCYQKWESWWYPSFEVGIKSLLKKNSFLRIVKEPSSNSNNDYYSLEEDNFPKLEKSKILSSLVQENKLYIKEGESRCLLFTGPPGTGKSCLMIQLAKELTTGYIKVPSSIAKTDSFWEIARIAQFPSILIDDIDHHKISSSLLSNLEQARKHVPLVLMSSNSTKSLKGALLRPGRVDKEYKIIIPDLNLVRKLSTHIPEKHLPDLEGLFISYIKELDIRCKVEGPEKIEEWLLEMHERTDQVGDGWAPNIKKEEDEEDDEEDEGKDVVYG